MRRSTSIQARYPVLRKLAGGSEFGLTTQVEMPSTAIDRGAMAVLAIISTEDVDRSQDVVSTAGIRLEQHRRSPVGLYDHGEHWTMPVSKYETPEGEYTVKLLDGYATGRAYYDQHNAMSEQVFGLIDRGFLRGHSIGFRPLQARKRNLYDEGGYRDDKARGLYVEECELLEVSATPVADNPNCVAIATEVLHKGRLCGRPLLDVVRKSLASYAIPVKRNQVVGGWTTQTKSHQPEEGNQDYGSQSLLALVALSGKLGGDDDDAVKRAMQLVVDGFEQGPDVDDVDGPSDPVVKAWSITKGWRHAPLDRQGASQNRYINTDTGKVGYFSKPPRGAEKASKQDEPGKEKASAQEDAPVKVQPETVDQKDAAKTAFDAIAGHLAKPESITQDDLQSIATVLSSGMKKEALQEVARHLNVAVSGVKTAIAVRIAEAMLKRAKGDPDAGKKPARGGRKPKAQPVPQPEAKPAPAQPKAEDGATVPAEPTSEFRKSVLDAVGYMTKLVEYSDGLVDMAALYSRMKRSNPDLTPDQFRSQLASMWKSGQVELHRRNDSRTMSEEERSLAVREGRNGETQAFGYVAIPRGKPASESKQSQAEPEKPREADLHSRALSALKSGISTLPELYDALSKSGDLTVGEFHDAVRDLARSGAVTLEAHRGPAHELQRSELVMSDGGKVASGIKATGKPYEGQRADRGKITPEATAKVADAVRAFQQANPYRTMGMDDLYKTVTADHPMSVGQFHEMLRGMAKRDEVELVPFTRPLHELPDSSLALMQDQEPKFYVAPGRNKPTAAPAQATPQPKAEPKPEPAPAPKPEPKPAPLPEAKSPYVGVSGAEARALQRASIRREQQRDTGPAIKQGDHYAALGIKPSATDAELKAAYRDAARKYHPDRNPGPGGEQRFQAAKDAYEALTNPEVRDEYDQRHSDASRQAHRQRQTQRVTRRQYDELRESLAQAMQEKKGSWMPWTPGLDRTIRRYQQAIANMERDHPTLKASVKKSYRVSRTGAAAGTNPGEWSQIIAQAMLLIASHDARKGDGPLSDKALAVLDALRDMQDSPDPELFSGPQDALFKSYYSYRKSNEWVKEEGKRGGNRWRRGNTVRYFPRGVDPNKAGRTDRAGVQARKEARQAMTAEAAREKLSGILGGESVGENAADEVHAVLSGMYRDEVRKLAKMLQASQSGEKRMLALTVAQAAVEKAKEGGWKRREEAKPAEERAERSGNGSGVPPATELAQDVSSGEKVPKEPWQMPLAELKKENPTLWRKIKEKYPGRDDRAFGEYLRSAYSRGLDVPLELRAAYAPQTLDSDEKANLNADRKTATEVVPHRTSLGEFMAMLPNPEYRKFAADWDRIVSNPKAMNLAKEMAIRGDILDADIDRVVALGLLPEHAPMMQVAGGQAKKHREEVADRVSRGDRLSDAVLADYPDLREAQEWYEDNAKVFYDQQSRRQAIMSALAGGRPVPSAVMADHPDLLASQSGPKEGDRNAEGLVLRGGRWRREGEDDAAPVPAQPGAEAAPSEIGITQSGNAAEIGNAAESFVKQWEQEKRTSCPLPDLFSSLRQKEPSLSIGAFHDLLRQMHQGGSVRMGVWSKPLDRLPNPELAIIQGRDVMYDAHAAPGKIDYSAMQLPALAAPTDTEKSDAAAFVQQWEGEKGSSCPMSDLYAHLRKGSPDLSVGAFQDILRDLEANGVISLERWSKPIDRLPDPKLAVITQQGVMYGVKSSPVAPLPVPAKTPTPRQAPVDAGEAGAEIKRLYDTAASTSVTREHIDAAAAKLASLSKPDLMLIAESLGMVGTHLKSKTALQEAIRDRILARKGATQRAGLLDRDENKNKAKADPAVGELAENLRHTLDRGEGNVGLFSAADEATAVSKLREMRPDLKPVDLGAAMEASMREQADKLRVQWPVVERAMAPDASESDRRNLQSLVNRALPKAIAAANDASGKSLIYGLGELARYGVDASEAVGLIHGGPLRDSRRQGASALVLVPDGADVSSGTSRQATALPVSMGGKPAEVTPAQQRSQQLLDEVAAQNLQASQAQLAQEEARRAEANRPEQEAAQQRAQQVAAERAADQAHNADVQARLGAAEAPATTTPTPTPADAAPTQPRKQIFTTGDVAKIMQVAPRTIGKWFDTGLLRGYRIPGSQDRRIPRDKLEAFLKEHMPPGQSLEEMEALAGFRKADKAAVAAADAAKQATPAKPAPSEPKPQKVQVPEHFADQGFTSDVAQHQGKSMAPGALIKQAQQSGRYSFVGLAQQTGWYTNGKIVFRLPPKEKEKFDSLPPAEGRLPDVASVIESTRKGADSAPATLAGARADPNNPKLTHYHLTSESGRQALVDGDQFETIKRRLPDATMHLGKTPDDPILFKQDGQAVGVLMPLHGIDRSGRVPYRDSVTKSYRRTGNPSIWRHRVRSRA